MRALATLLLITSFTVALPRASADEAADHISRARELKAKLEYRAALPLVEQTIALGKANPDELAEMHLLAGELLAGLGEADRAVIHFASYLALVPGGKLEPGASPKLADPFIAARSTLDGQALGASHRASGNTLEVIVDDPRNMVGSARLTAGGETIILDGSGPFQFSLPATRPLSIVVEVLDEHGNQLIVLGEEPATIVLRASERAWIARPSTWAIAAGAAGAASLTFALLARSAQSDLDALLERARDSNEPPVSYDEVLEVEARGKRHALVTNVTLGMAGAAAAAAVTLYFLQRGDGDDRPREPTVSVSTGEGKLLTVGAQIHF